MFPSGNKSPGRGMCNLSSSVICIQSWDRFMPNQSIVSDFGILEDMTGCEDI